MPRQTNADLVELLQNVSRNDRLSIELGNGTTCNSVVEWNQSNIREDGSMIGEIRIAIEIDSTEIPSQINIFSNQVLRIIGKQPSGRDCIRPVFYVREANQLTGQSGRSLDITHIDVEETA
jgi:hypothetical protein